MRHVPITDDICRISDRDLWTALRAPWSGMPDTAGADLKRALTHGKAGRHTEAYSALADYHRRSLETQWRDLEATVQADGPVSEKVLQQAMSTRPWAIRSTTEQYGRLRNIRWLQALLHHVIQTRDATCLRHLMRCLPVLYRWRNDHPPPKGIEHPMYASLGGHQKARLYAGVYMAVLFNDMTCPAELSEATMKVLLGNARFLHRWIRPFRVHNVHTAGCTALFYIARLCPEFADSGKWDALSSRYLHRTLKQAFFSDGGHKERVWGYGFYTLENLHNAYTLAQRHGGFGKHDRDYLRRLKHNYKWFAKTLGPGDFKPAYGDCELFNGRRLIDTAQPLFPSGTDRYFGVDRTQSYLLRPSGFAVMRNGDDDKTTFLSTTFGKFAGWHSHHDTLSMNLFAFGKPLLEEFNRFGSYGNPLDMVGRAPSSHNQVLIDEFFYDNRGKPIKDLAWHSDDEVDYFSAYHTAYRWLPNVDGCGYIMSMDAIVRRTIVFVKRRGYALVLDSVRDELSDHFNRAVTSHWHSPFGFTTIDGQSARTKGTPGCLVQFAHAEGLKAFLIEPDYAGADAAQDEPLQERWHLRARRWFAEGTKHHSTGFATLLYPFKGRQPRAGITPMDLPDSVIFRAEGFEVRTPAGVDRFLLDPERLGALRYQGKALDGRAIVRLDGRRKAITIR